jgi:hypothetical protein
MAKKRVFSNKKHGGDVYLRGQRPRLSYGELEQRRRPVEGDSSERSRQQSERDRGPAEMAAGDPRQTRAPRRSRSAPRQAARERPARRKGHGPTGTHLAIGAVAALALLLPLLFFLFVYPSPIGSLSPANGAYVKTPNVEIKATIDHSFKPQDITIKIDGKDAAGSIKVDKKTVSAVVPLGEGPHKASLLLSGGGLMGKRTAAWSFNVDSQPPDLKLTEKKVTDLKKGQMVRVDIEGTADKGSTVLVAGKPVEVDAKGKFQSSAETTRVQSLKVSAKDPAGNEATDFVVTQKTPQAKGAHVSIFIAASDTDLAKMIGLVERTELNALEIDVKDEAGTIGFNIDYPLAQQAKAASDYEDLESIVDQLRYRDIYSICRVVCFKDPKLGKARPDLAIQSKGGGVWSTGAWLDPYSREVWDYDLAVAEAAAKAGFNEVQFDYVRFPSDGNVKDCVYPHQDARPPPQVIDDFLSYARQRLAPYNVFISADLFGLTASGQGDMNIGQRVVEVAQRTDFISPMVYPSHYNAGEYNIKVPEANPGDTVTKSLEDFKKKMAGTDCGLRPWLQDFSLRIAYSPDMVRRQIDATEALGIKQWLLWDPDCTYSEAALKPKNASK